MGQKIMTDKEMYGAETQEEWRLRVYGKSLLEEMENRRKDPAAWRRRGRRTEPKVGTWLWPVAILLTLIFITATLTGDPDEPWFYVCPSCDSTPTKELPQ